MTFARKMTEWLEKKAERKEANLRALLTPTRSLHRGSYETSGTTPEPKTAPKRNAVLLEMARGRICLLMVPGVCTGDVATTVACHSNWQEHGKAGARKADDCYTVWGCVACHSWLDSGKADAQTKRRIFSTAHASQQWLWRRAQQDPIESERFRRAAAWALEQLEEQR
jgi:hypothetical protein